MWDKVLGSSAANNGIKPERSATTNGGNSTSSGNSSITDAYNKNLIKTNEIYNSSHPNNPINPLQGTVNYSGGKATVESSATSNNGNTTSSGKDGNSPEGIACAKEAQSEYEQTREYHDYNENKNNINAPVLRYGELAKAKNAEVLLQHCSQYLNAQEQAMLKSVSASCRKNASEMNGNTINTSPQVSAQCKTCMDNANRNYPTDFSKKYFSCGGSGAALACDGNVPPGCVCIAHGKRCYCDICGKNLAADIANADSQHQNAINNCQQLCK